MSFYEVLHVIQFSVLTGQQCIMPNQFSCYDYSLQLRCTDMYNRYPTLALIDLLTSLKRDHISRVSKLPRYLYGFLSTYLLLFPHNHYLQPLFHLFAS